MQLNSGKYHSASQSDGGFILVTVLLLLSILSLSAYLAIERSQFSLKTNHNRIAHLQARHNAEESRLIALPILHALLLDRDKSALAAPGVTINASPNLLNAPGANAQTRLQKAALFPLLSIKQAELKGELFVQALPSQLNTQGVSLTQHMAYQGAGQGLGAAGSFSKFYELRSKGSMNYRGAELSYWSASDYRFVP
jgi:hypothetical protein